MAAEAHSIDWELRLGFLIHDVSRLRRSAFDRCLKPLKSQLAHELDLGKVAVGGLIDRLEKAEAMKHNLLEYLQTSDA